MEKLINKLLLDLRGNGLDGFEINKKDDDIGF